jgi:hypothetical protein
MWFLRLLINVVSNILLSIKPNKCHDRAKSTAIKSDTKFGAKNPAKVDFPATGTIETYLAPPGKKVFHVISDVEEHNPNHLVGRLEPDPPKEVSEENVVYTQINSTEIPVQDDAPHLIIKDNAVPTTQNEVSIPTSSIEPLQKEIELETNTSANLETVQQVRSQIQFQKLV